MVSIFERPNRRERREEEKREEEEEEEKKKRREEERKIKKVWKLRVFVWIHDFCMDFSMIFEHKLLGYGLLGFSLEINLVPFSRVLLGIHPNSRLREVWLKIPS